MIKIAKFDDSTKIDLRRMETKVIELEKELGSTRCDTEKKMLQIERVEAALTESYKQNKAQLNESDSIKSQKRELKKQHEKKDMMILNCTADVETMKEQLQVCLPKWRASVSAITKDLYERIFSENRGIA